MLNDLFDFWRVSLLGTWNVFEELNKYKPKFLEEEMNPALLQIAGSEDLGSNFETTEDGAEFNGVKDRK